jgi:hypothetical protein
VLFEKRFWERIRAGEVTVTFRRWKRRQVVAGHRYRTAAGMLEVISLTTVEPDGIADDDARRAGYAKAADLVADLRGTPDLPTYRIEFRTADEPDPRDVLARRSDLTESEIAEIDRRLDRLDRASSHGAWTRETLATIAAHPGRRAPDLAEIHGRLTQPFKTDVRKLKNLGLTISLPVGYRLSPRGETYVRTLNVQR